jgi:hypothetical protein
MNCETEFSDGEEEPHGPVSPQLFNKVWRRLEAKVERRVQEKMAEQYGAAAPILLAAGPAAATGAPRPAKVPSAAIPGTGIGAAAPIAARPKAKPTAAAHPQTPK